MYWLFFAEGLFVTLDYHLRLLVNSYKSPSRWCVCTPLSPIFKFKFNFFWRVLGLQIFCLKVEEDPLVARA